MRILVQFIAQSAGVVLLRKRLGSSTLPFRMWLYPLPVILSVLIWLFLLYYNKFALYGVLIALAGVIVYFIVNRKKRIDKN